MATPDAPTAHATILAKLLDEALAGQWEDSPAVVALMGGVDESGRFDLALKTLGGHPLRELRGFVAEEKWVAVGLSTLGQAASTLPGCPLAERVRITLAISADDEASLLRRPNTDDVRQLPAAEGEVPELLRKVLRSRSGRSAIHSRQSVRTNAQRHHCG